MGIIVHFLNPRPGEIGGFGCARQEMNKASSTPGTKSYREAQKKCTSDCGRRATVVGWQNLFCQRIEETFQ